MDQREVLKTAMLAGEIILRSGAEIFRVEDTMRRILALSGSKEIEIYATTTGIIATLADDGYEPLTLVKRIDNRANNLNRIYLVNKVSRRLCEWEITPGEAYEELLIIKHIKEYQKGTIALATMVSTMAFTVLFGGRTAEVFTSACNGAVMALMQLWLARYTKSDFMKNALIAMLIAAITGIIDMSYPSIRTSQVIIGTIMPLVPGIPITNAIRDTLQGDYMSGLARAAEAFVAALAIAVGVGAGLGLLTLGKGGLFL